MTSHFISLELTEKCNNSCKHCYNFWRANGRSSLDDKHKALSRLEIQHLIRKVRKDIPLEYIALSGGEPLLRSDFPQIANDVVDAGLQLVIITNGVLLDKNMLRQLPREVSFEITLLGHTAELHDKLAGNKVFDRVVQNTSQIRRHGSRFTVVFVATKLNALDVFRTAELGIALGATAFMYNRVNLSRPMRPYATDLMPPAKILEESLNYLQNAVKKYGVPAICSVPIPPCVVDISKFPQINFGWCPRGGDKSYYTIGCTGLVRPCNHSSVILGDLKSQGFAQIISSDKCRVFWQTVPVECDRCEQPLRDRCQGGCTAASDEFFGSQRRIDPICELSKHS